MPLYKFSILSPTSFLLVWKIEESVELLYAQLHPLLCIGLASFSSKDRMRQSLAVRLALCTLLKKLGLPVTTLSKNRQGKPLLENRQLHISFTHTHYFAAVALSIASPIGIDIEMVRPKLRSVQTIFLTEEEQQHANIGALKKRCINF